MPIPHLVELKRALVREGFEIYRVASQTVTLAERVRDNLIMDSGVALRVDEPDSLRVRVVLRAQSSEFPGDEPLGLLKRAGRLASPFSERGYREAGAELIVVNDPGDPTRVIDTYQEVAWERAVDDLSAAVEELRFALGQQKTALRSEDASSEEPGSEK